MIPSWNDTKRILAVQLGGIEAVALTTPALRAISDGAPHATLTLMTSTEGARMAWLDDDIDDLIEFTPPWMRPATEWSPGEESSVVAQLRAGNFDAAIIFTTLDQSPLYAAALCARANIPLRVALTNDNPHHELTMRVFPDAYPHHEVERMLKFVAALGFEVEEQDLVATVPDDACARIFDTFATLRLNNERPLVLVWPGTTAVAYPADRFAATIDRLIEQRQVNVFLLGCEEERVRQIYAQLSDNGRRSTARLATDLPFDLLAAMAETADIVITHDGAIMQLAAAVKTPVVAICPAGLDVATRAPWHVRARVLWHDAQCRHDNPEDRAFGLHCLSAVRPHDVTQAAMELLDEISPHSGSLPTCMTMPYSAQ